MITETEIESVPLGQVAKFIRGINFKPADVVTQEAKNVVACMRTKNVQAKLDQSDVWFVGREFVKRDEQMLREGDLLISSANSWNLVGKCCWIPTLPGPATFGGFICALRACSDELHARYLYHWFASPRIQTTVRSYGRQTTNISNLDIKRCEKLPIPLPPLSEQKRIAAILDRAEALRAQRRAALALLDELTQSIFLDMFGDPVTNPMGWERRKLGDITSIDAPMVDPRLGDYRKLLHYGPDRIEKETGELLPAKTAEQDGLISGKFLCSPGEILYSKIRPYLNKVALVKQKCLCSADVYPVRPDCTMLTKEYLALLLRSPAFLDYVAGFSRRANIPKLNRKQFSNYNAPVPPLDVQNRFSEIVQAVEKQKVSVRSCGGELDALFDSLQQRAFRGEL